MKMIGEYTARGSIRSDRTLNRIILDDGRFDTAYRVTHFELAPHTTGSTTAQVYTGKLLTNDDQAAGENWNWDRNGEIAWAMFAFDANGVSTPNVVTTVDPDNLVVQDLFVLADEGVGSDVKVNYMIKMEKYDITDSQGALAMVRNRSQA